MKTNEPNDRLWLASIIGALFAVALLSVLMRDPHIGLRTDLIALAAAWTISSYVAYKALKRIGQ